MLQTEETDAIRRFNRFWTKHMGVLDAGLLDTPYSLTEARVIFELGRRGTGSAGPQNGGAGSGATDLLGLRRTLDIDAGYLSRIMKRFERDGLVETTSSPTDGRRRVLRLTDRGKSAFEDLDVRSSKQVQAMQAGLTAEEQRRLVSAMATIRGLLDPARGPRASVIRPPLPGDLGWVVHRHG